MIVHDSPSLFEALPNIRATVALTSRVSRLSKGRGIRSEIRVCFPYPTPDIKATSRLCQGSARSGADGKCQKTRLTTVSRSRMLATWTRRLNFSAGRRLNHEVQVEDGNSTSPLVALGFLLSKEQVS